MKHSTIRSLLVTCVVLDIALLGVVLYDYFQNDSAWVVGVLVTFAIFVLVTAILFMLAGRAEASEPAPAPPAETIVVKEVVVDHLTTPAEPAVPAVPRPLDYERERHPPIPPAPIRFMLETPPKRVPAPAMPADSGIPFTFNGYTLYTKDVVLKNGGKRAIYFFSKRKPRSGRMCAKPRGHHVGVNERTGLPFLKRGAGPDGEDLTPAAKEAAYRPQCAALTEDGLQCRNSAREGSKYCGSHFGYQPPVMAKATVDETDTVARVPDAPDTKPSARKSWFGRRKRASA